MTMTGAAREWPELVLTNEQLMKLPEYSSSIPTGTTIGKRWRRWTGQVWIVGEYIPAEPDHRGQEMVGIKWHRIRRPEQWFKGEYAVIRHPRERDPYGVLTLGLVHEYARMVEGFVQGWAANSNRHRTQPRYPDYHSVYQYAAGIADIPSYLCAQMALYFSSPHNPDKDCIFPFRPLL